MLLPASAQLALMRVAQMLPSLRAAQMIRYLPALAPRSCCAPLLAPLGSHPGQPLVRVLSAAPPAERWRCRGWRGSPSFRQRIAAALPALAPAARMPQRGPRTAPVHWPRHAPHNAERIAQQQRTRAGSIHPAAAPLRCDPPGGAVPNHASGSCNRHAFIGQLEAFQRQLTLARLEGWRRPFGRVGIFEIPARYRLPLKAIEDH